MAKKKDKTPAATFGSIALQNYTAQRGYEIGQDTSLGETLKPAVNLLGEYAKNAEKERGKFISSLPDDFKVELLPTSGKEAFTNFASDAKQKYSEAAGLAAKYSANPNSEQYRNAVKDMESIKGGLSNSFDSYTKLADLRQGYINNEKAKNKPIAMDAKEDQIYTAITEGDYKNFENTTDGLVYNYENLDGVVEQIPFNELPNTKFVDSEMSTNVIANVLKNPYAAGVNGDDMEASLSTANNEVQKLITTPEGYRQAVFNGFDGPKTKFIDYYVGEQFITDKDETFLNGINDINTDGEITKDDMQNGVWSFKEGPKGEAARLAFERKITDHQNDKDFDVKTQLSEFMNGIAKDKYLEGEAQKLKNETYNLPGFGKGLKHSQVQVLFDKLNNNEVIRDGAANDYTEYTPAPGRPGFYTVPVTNEDGSKGLSELLPRDMVEDFLGINAVRDDFNVDPVKAANTEETPVMLDFGVGDLKNKSKVKSDTDKEVKVDETDGNTEGQDWSIETVDYINQEKKARPSAKQKSDLLNVLKNLDKKMIGKNLGDNDFDIDPDMSEQELNDQIKLSNQYINEIEKVYLGTGLINSVGSLARFDKLSRIKSRKAYELEKSRNSQLKEQLLKLNPTEVTKEEEGGGEEPVVATEVNNAPKERIPMDGIDYSLENPPRREVPSTEVYNLKPITQDQFVSTEGVQSKIGEIATKHGFSADELIKLIKFETGGSFDPSQKSGASSAVGLIQFMPETIKGLNKELDSEKVAAMTILEQLELVDAYFASQPNSVKGSHPYLQVATPRAATIGPDEILYKKDSKEAKANKSWQNENGDVTPNSILTGAGFDPMPSTQA